MRYQYKPRKSFERNLVYLAQLDVTIIDEVKDAIFILLDGDILPNDFHDHKLITMQYVNDHDAFYDA